MEGENLLVGFAEENGGRVMINDLSSSGTSFIPKGLVHFEMNLGCKTSSYLSIYSSVDPGIVYMSRGFDLPIEVLETTFNLSEEQINMIQKYLPKAPHAGVKNFGFDECIERCQKSGEYETESHEVKKTRYPVVMDASTKPSYVQKVATRTGSYKKKLYKTLNID